MRIGLVVDSSCDLPRDFIERYGIVIIPISVEVDGRVVEDLRDENVTRRFYREHLASRNDARSIPCSVESIRDLILSRLVHEFDYVFFVTIASSRSPIFDNAMNAAESLRRYKIQRQTNINGAPWIMRVIDSQNAFAAEALVAAAAAQRLAQGGNLLHIRDEMRNLVPMVHGYMLPRDLHHLRKRARARGDRSISWLSASLGNAMDIKPLIKGYRNETFACAKLRNFEYGAEQLFRYAARRVQCGLTVPIVTTCYAGEVSEMQALPGYQHLAEACARHNVELLSSMMSISGAANVGEGALGLALADDPHDFEEG